MRMVGAPASWVTPSTRKIRYQVHPLHQDQLAKQLKKRNADTANGYVIVLPGSSIGHLNK